MDIVERIKNNFNKGFFGKGMLIPELPEELVMDVCLCRHQQVRSAQVHPNVEKLDEFTVRYVAKNPTELNVMREFIMG